MPALQQGYPRRGPKTPTIRGRRWSKQRSEDATGDLRRPVSDPAGGCRRRVLIACSNVANLLLVMFTVAAARSHCAWRWVQSRQVCQAVCLLSTLVSLIAGVVALSRALGCFGHPKLASNNLPLEAALQ